MANFGFLSLSLVAATIVVSGSLVVVGIERQLSKLTSVQVVDPKSSKSKNRNNNKNKKDNNDKWKSDEAIFQRILMESVFVLKENSARTGLRLTSA